jgi:hypothetical protein
MAIRKLREVPREALAGKFICTPSRYTFQEFGWPALIEKTTAARMTVLRLPRGVWDPQAGEWQVRPTTTLPAVTYVNEPESDVLEGGGREERELYNLASVLYVCDTAAEAIALYVQALATRNAIEDFRKAQLAALNEQAIAGALPIPAYLNQPTA